MPVPPPTFPSGTGPEVALSSASKASSGFTWNPLTSFNSPSHVSATTGNDHQYSESAGCPCLILQAITASRTTPTLCVFVIMTGPSRKPDSSTQVVPVISPLPFSENQPAKTESVEVLPRGRIAVTPVRTGPCPATSLPSPEISVFTPISTPFTSVIASSGPGVPSKGTPKSRALTGRGAADWARAVTPTASPNPAISSASNRTCGRGTPDPSRLVINTTPPLSSGWQIAHRSIPSARVPEVYYFSVVHFVFLTFKFEMTARARFSQAPVSNQIVVGDYLRADESLLDVAVNLTRGVERCAPGANRPGTALILAHSEERDQIEEAVPRADKARDRRFLQPIAFHELSRFSVGELGHLRFHLAANRGDHGARLTRQAHFVRELVRGFGACSVRFVEVQHVDHRLPGEKGETANQFLFLLVELHLSQWNLLLKRLLAFLNHLQFFLERRILQLLDVLGEALDSLFDHRQVRDHQLQVRGLHVALGIHLAARSRNCVVVKRAYHVGERIHLLDVRGSARSRAQKIDDAARSVQVLHRSVHGLLRVIHGRKPVEPCVGHGHDADMDLGLRSCMGP